MLDLAFLSACNRLLERTPWARQKLQPFAGARARLSLGRWPIDFRIAADGTFESTGSGAPAVSIELREDALFDVLRADRAGLLRGARISGAADFAEGLGFVLRNLDWDAEEDLSRLVGDVAARRIVRSARGLAGTFREAGERFAGNVVEYLRYERPAGVSTRELAAFTREVAALDTAVTALARRIDTLA